MFAVRGSIRYIPPRSSTKGESMKKVMIALLLLAGCGTTATTATSEKSTISSISQLPNIQTLVMTEAGAANLAAKAVSGTPPLLTDITATSADTYFWDGLIADVTAAGSVTTQNQVDNFWTGEGSCRSAQGFGYAFQNILQGASTLCYMQNMPTAANGVTVTSGTLADHATIFDQQDTDRVIQVSITKGSANQSGQTIFIKVFGTASETASTGYAADLWYCKAGDISGYETLRVDSDGIFSDTSIGTDLSSESQGVNILTGAVKKQGTEFIFDPSKQRAANVYYKQGDNNIFMSSITITGGQLTAKDYGLSSWDGGITTTTNKDSIVGQYTGDTMATVKLSAVGAAVQDNFSGVLQTEAAASEFRDTHYVSVTSGTLYTAATAETFTDPIFDGTATTSTALLDKVSDYDCSVTPDIAVAIDFTATATAAIGVECENNFQDMNFCDDPTINNVRQNTFDFQQTQFQDQGCPTSPCSTGDDFSCQIFADNNPSSGLTTANARCMNNCCAAQ